MTTASTSTKFIFDTSRRIVFSHITILFLTFVYVILHLIWRREKNPFSWVEKEWSGWILGNEYFYNNWGIHHNILYMYFIIFRHNESSDNLFIDRIKVIKIVYRLDQTELSNPAIFESLLYLYILGLFTWRVWRQTLFVSLLFSLLTIQVEQSI